MDQQILPYLKNRKKKGGRKGLEYWFSLESKAQKGLPPARALCMVGDGEERALRSLAKETETKMGKEVWTHQKKISWIDYSVLNLVLYAAALY